MNGELAQAVALVAHSRVALLSRQPFSMTLSSSTLKYVGALEFEREVPRLLRGSTYESIATEPREWYGHLIGTGARSISLAVERTGGRLEDHLAVAFAGGGSWAIEVSRDKRHSLWRAQWLARNSSVPDDRIWSVLYREFEVGELSSRKKSVRSASSRLARVLTDAADFARDARLDFWFEWFHSAQEKLKADQPTFAYHPDMLPPLMYTADARRLLSASERAWVFGGMGSWNDLGFSDGELQRRYGSITPELYQAVLEGVMAATNEDFA